MALAPGSGEANEGRQQIDARELRLFVMALFFFFGCVTSWCSAITAAFGGYARRPAEG